MEAGQGEKPPFWTKKLTRRAALKVAVIGLAGLAGTAILKNLPRNPSQDQQSATSESQSPKSATELKEPLKLLPANIVAIDFAPNEPQEGINQTEFPDRDLLTSMNIPQDIRDYIVNSFGSHGEDVASAMRKTLERFGFTSTVNLYPLQNALDPQKIEVSKEVEIPYSAGGLGHNFFLTIDHNKLAEVMQQYPDQKVVNLSLQLGKVGIARIEKERTVGKYELPPGGYIDENGELSLFGDAGISSTNSGVKPMRPNGEVIDPISKAEYEKLRKEKEENVTEIIPLKTPIVRKIEAYSRKDVEQNLPHLFALCKAFPNKLFVAAAGNEGEDLRVMQGRPANLLIIAEWNRWETKPEHDVYGADIYVDNSALTLPHGSSFSTPAIAALGSIFTNQGLSVEETKQKILEATEIVNFMGNGNGTKQEAPVLNPDKIKTSS